MQTDVNCKLEDNETGKNNVFFHFLNENPRYEIQDEK